LKFRGFRERNIKAGDTRCESILGWEKAIVSEIDEGQMKSVTRVENELRDPEDLGRQ
jgi:hypothetical protein